MATALVRPPGREEFPLDLIGLPRWVNAAAGGHKVATVPCLLDSRHRDRLLDADMRIFPARGRPWIGRVATIQQEGRLASLRCTGRQVDLERMRRAALYGHTRTSDWTPCESNAMDPNIRVVVAGDAVRFNIRGGVDYPTGARQQAYLIIPETTGGRVTLSWSRYSDSWRLRLYSGTYARQASTGAPETGSAMKWEELNGTTDLTGSETVDIDVTPGTMTLLLFDVYNTSGGVAGADSSIYFHDIKVYGVADDSANVVTSVTGPNIIGDVCDRLPPWILPAGDEYRNWIAADPTTIEPFGSKLDRSELDILEDMLRYRDFDFGFWSRLVGGRYDAVPVYEQRSTTPAYEVFPGFTGSLDIVVDDITSMADAVRVVYRDHEGHTRFVDVTETDEDNYLVEIGQAKMDVIRAETQSSSTATLMGQKYLAQRVARRVAGTMTLESPIVDARGREVLPCEIESCKYIRIHDTPYGTVDARIEQDDHEGDFVAKLTLDSQPTSFASELAMLRKRAR